MGVVEAVQLVVGDVLVFGLVGVQIGEGEEGERFDGHVLVGVGEIGEGRDEIRRPARSCRAARRTNHERQMILVIPGAQAGSVDAAWQCRRER